MRLRQRPRLLLAAALLGACSSSPTAADDPAVADLRLARIPSGSQASDRAALDSAVRTIRTLAGSGTCADGGCTGLAVGAKACGGPSTYVAYCPTSPEADRLRALAAEVTRAERAYNERYGIISTCDLAAPPAACRLPE